MPQRDDVLDATRYLEILQRRWRAIVVVAAVVLGTVAFLTLSQTPLYTAQAELEIEPVRLAADVATEEGLISNRGVETESRVVTSEPVAERVIADLGLTMSTRAVISRVDVTVVRQTFAVTVKATDQDPALAAALANAFPKAYLDLRREEALENLTAAGAALEQQARLLDAQLAEVSAIADDLTADDAARIPAIAERDALLREVGTLSAQRVALDSQSEIVRGGGSVLRSARIPTSPSSPDPVLNGGLGLLLALGLGVIVAMLKEFQDDSLHSEEMLTQASGGAPVFGRIPMWGTTTDRVLAITSPRDPAVEAYRALRANVRFAASNRAPARGATAPRTPIGRSLLITSSIAGEGKTSTAANLAVVAAEGGARVVLLDADLRRPRISSLFGISGGQGLSDQLAEGGSVVPRMVRTSNPNLVILPSGPIPPNPSVLLASRTLSDLLSELEALCDMVIIDAPPVLAAVDALEIGQVAGNTLLVASSTRSSIRAIRRASARLQQGGVTIGGAILNMADEKHGDRYYGYYAQDDRATASKQSKKDARKAAKAGTTDQSAAATSATVTTHESTSAPTTADSLFGQ